MGSHHLISPVSVLVSSCLTLHAYVNRLSRRYFSIFQVNIVSALVTLEFSLRHSFGDKIARGCPWGLLGLGESCLGLVCLYVFLPFSILVSWLGADFLFFFPFLSACRMARSQEETSTSQPSRKRGPTRGDAFYKQHHLLFIYGGVEGLLSNSR